MFPKFRISILGLLILVLIDLTVQNKCTVDTSKTEAIGWRSSARLSPTCNEKLEAQIKTELRAAVQYLAMSAYFLNDKHYRPGTSSFFLKNAIEERAHAKKFMEYLLLRGAEINSTAIPTIKLGASSWASVKKAFETALSMEQEVTAQITEIISICGGEIQSLSQTNDYHTVDYLTSEFLREQHESERRIVGHLTTLGRLDATSTQGSSVFAELLFDKTLK